MGSSSADNKAMRIVTRYSLFTCIYIPLYMFILVYYKNFHNIGKRSSMLLIAALVFAECLKLSFSCMVGDKCSKARKFNIRNVLKSMLVIVAMIVVYYIVAVLFGAPFTSQQDENLMFSLLLTALTVFPSCLNVGPDASISIITGVTACSNDSMVTMIRHNVYFTIFGAWLGAAVIPLDWDRPWQVWPIPCSLGAILGYVCSHILFLVNLAPKFTRLFVKKTGKYGL